jgi:hypothetical protein
VQFASLRARVQITILPVRPWHPPTPPRRVRSALAPSRGFFIRSSAISDQLVLAAMVSRLYTKVQFGADAGPRIQLGVDPLHHPPPPQQRGSHSKPRQLFGAGAFLCARAVRLVRVYRAYPSRRRTFWERPSHALPDRGIEGRPYGAGCPATRQSFTWTGCGRVPGILKTPCAAHRIDQPSPNFGRSVERPSLTGAIILVCPVALTFPCKPVTCILLLRRGNAFYLLVREHPCALTRCCGGCAQVAILDRVSTTLCLSKPGG